MKISEIQNAVMVLCNNADALYSSAAEPEKDEIDTRLARLRAETLKAETERLLDELADRQKEKEDHPDPVSMEIVSQMRAVLLAEKKHLTGLCFSLEQMQRIEKQGKEIEEQADVSAFKRKLRRQSGFDVKSGEPTQEQ